MLRIDMHVHSTFSDGTSTVEQIVRSAHGRGISVLALTDHDTTEGLPDFFSCCRRYKIRPLSGVELSAQSPLTIHILGYRIKQMGIFEKSLNWIRERRAERNRAMCERLSSLGLDICIEDIEAEARGQVVARPHFASALVRRGYVANMQSAFSKYLAKGAPAYVERESYSPEDCVRIVRESGGLPVLAHPSLVELEAEDMDALLSRLKGNGLWGLECISSHCSSQDAYSYLKLADRHALFATAGSDFHGTRRPDIALGVQVPEDFLPWARLGLTL